ncbi:hypothetical protein QLQ12_24690 [Actinoplanes sp. NEAU-A12]|uniref:Uncharacterized protein n=1 Tax=Actinoplanes sandaracinus TaxID=3045177 RepID=A0ABT6WQB1_9ACTN|nr:hypothetical protein [Actinoplanes sandaracinus]MDI6101825.1 hypothetical protein [Actinoplanes sandaracinus]
MSRHSFSLGDQPAMTASPDGVTPRLPRLPGVLDGVRRACRASWTA